MFEPNQIACVHMCVRVCVALFISSALFMLMRCPRDIVAVSSLQNEAVFNFRFIYFSLCCMLCSSLNCFTFPGNWHYFDAVPFVDVVVVLK